MQMGLCVGSLPPSSLKGDSQSLRAPSPNPKPQFPCGLGVEDDSLRVRMPKTSGGEGLTGPGRGCVNCPRS